MIKKNLLLIVLCALLFSLLYVNNNKNIIYSRLGDYYFKNNNMEKAQECFEKAFAMGINDTKQRDLYVNSIKNLLNLYSFLLMTEQNLKQSIFYTILSGKFIKSTLKII